MGRFVRESVTDTSTNTHIYSSDYRYDDNNNVDFIGVNAGNSYSAMIYSYGTDNLPLGYTGALGTGMYTYDALNRLSSISHTIAPKKTYTYYDTAQMATTRVKDEAFADTAQGTVSYAYDSNGNITRKTTTVSGVATDILYTYDEFNRLVIEQNEHLNQTVRYKYDAWGNIAMKWVFAGASTATPAEADLIKAYDYVYSSSSLSDVTTWKDLLTEYDGEDITYDVIGNPLAYRGAAMTWKGRSLASYSKNGTTITYSYDSSDMRTSKTVGGVKHNYYYVEGKLMYEDCPSYKLYYTYDANGFLSGIQKIENVGFVENFGVHCNMFGDVIAIYDTNGIIRAKYNYDSWGKIISVEDAYGNDITGGNDICTYNSIRYRGYVYDEETGLYYLQSRYYDPNTCRFINADGYVTTGQGLTSYNMFAYCGNNPIMYSDPSGNMSIAATMQTLEKMVTLSKNICTNDIINNWNNLGNSSSGDLSSIEMHENAEIIFNILTSEGWSTNAICAVLGNMQHESVTINPGRYQNGGGPGYGIVQWDPASKYLNWAAKQGYSSDSLTGQVAFLVYSMQPGKGEWFKNSNYPTYYLPYKDFISSNSDITYLTSVFVWSYERPGIAHMDKRIAYATYWYNYFS